MCDLKSKSLTDFFFLRPPAFNFCQRRFSSIYGHSMRKKIINKDIHTRNSAQKRQSKYIFSRWANPVISMLRFCSSPNRFHAFKIESKKFWKKLPHLKTDVIKMDLFFWLIWLSTKKMKKTKKQAKFNKDIGEKFLGCPHFPEIFPMWHPLSIFLSFKKILDTFCNQITNLHF